MKTIEDIKQAKIDELENKLNNFKIDDDLKDAYIISEFNKIVEDIDEDELNELINDNDNYYNDCNMHWIYDFLYNLFDDSHTINEIDDTICLLFGYYSYTRLVKFDEQIYVIFD